MSKKQKAGACRGKKYRCQYQYWWVVCVYLFVPIILMLLFDKAFAPLLQKFMAGVRIGGGKVLNSAYAVENVIYPFVESLMIITGAIVSYVVLKFVQKKLLKRKIYFVGAKKCLRYFEIATVLFAVIIAVYGKTNNFDYSQYGYSADTIKEFVVQENVQYIPLEKIPSIHSIGIEIRGGNLLYNLLLHISQFAFRLSDNLEMIIAIVGTVLIPLKKYSEEVEGKR